jgi:hypothetical protein
MSIELVLLGAALRRREIRAASHGPDEGRCLTFVYTMATDARVPGSAPA